MSDGELLEAVMSERDPTRGIRCPSQKAGSWFKSLKKIYPVMHEIPLKPVSDLAKRLSWRRCLRCKVLLNPKGKRGFISTRKMCATCGTADTKTRKARRLREQQEFGAILTVKAQLSEVNSEK